MRSIEPEQVLRVNCPGFGTESHFTLGTAKPLKHYRVLVINPTSIIHLFDKDPHILHEIDQAQHQGMTSYTTKSDSLLQSIQPDLKQRHDELAEFLGAGGLLVYFLCPPFRIEGPSEVLDNYCWLDDLAPDKPHEQNKRHMSSVGSGKHFELAANAEYSAFVRYLKQAGMEWHTLIREENLSEGYEILATAGNHKCVSARKKLSSAGGQIVFLPAPYKHDFDKQLTECIKLWHGSQPSVILQAAHGQQERADDEPEKSSDEQAENARSYDEPQAELQSQEGSDHYQSSAQTEDLTSESQVEVDLVPKQEESEKPESFVQPEMPCDTKAEIGLSSPQEVTGQEPANKEPACQSESNQADYGLNQPQEGVIEAADFEPKTNFNIAFESAEPTSINEPATAANYEGSPYDQSQAYQFAPQEPTKQEDSPPSHWQQAADDTCPFSEPPQAVLSEMFTAGQAEPSEEPAREESPRLARAKEFMKKMVNIGKSAAPEWCMQYSFSDLDNLRKDLAELNLQLESTQLKIQQTEAQISQLEELKNALLWADEEQLRKACTTVFEKLGFACEINSEDAKEMHLKKDNQTEGLAHIIRSTSGATRPQLAQLAESVITYWGEHGNEPKGILVASTFADTPPVERKENDYADDLNQFAEKKHLCLVTSAQLLCIYRDLTMEKIKPEDMRQQLLAVSGRLAGFSLEKLEYAEVP